MDARKRSKWEKRLQEERQSALDSLGTLERTDASDDGELSNYPQHLADEGTDTMEQEKSYLLASQEGRLLYRIDEALRRLYKQPEEFGHCAICGSEIIAERLDLLPWTTTCAEHAEQDDSTGAAR